MATIDRESLMSALAACGQREASDCADQLRVGVEVRIHDESLVSAWELAGIYRVRAEHVRRIAFDARGLDEAVVHFDAEDGAGLIMCDVEGLERYYAFWLTSDGSRVVACVSTPGDASRPDRDEVLAWLRRGGRAAS